MFQKSRHQNGGPLFWLSMNFRTYSLSYTCSLLIYYNFGVIKNANIHFFNKKTKKEYTDMMTIADMEEYLSKNKHISQVIKGLNIVSGVSGITHKIDSGWKENLQRISEAHPNSALAERHGKKTIKQVKTENVLSKHRNRQTKGT
jgi:hypothetical protein